MISKEFARTLHDTLIENVSNRNWYNQKYGIGEIITDEQTEVHHIIPRSKGGTDDKGNLVVLTIKEHILVHAYRAIGWDCKPSMQMLKMNGAIKHLDDIGELDAISESISVLRKQAVEQSSVMYNATWFVFENDNIAYSLESIGKRKFIFERFKYVITNKITSERIHNCKQLSNLSVCPSLELSKYRRATKSETLNFIERCRNGSVKPITSVDVCEIEEGTFLSGNFNHDYMPTPKVMSLDCSVISPNSKLRSFVNKRFGRKKLFASFNGETYSFDKLSGKNLRFVDNITLSDKPSKKQIELLNKNGVEWDVWVGSRPMIGNRIVESSEPKHNCEVVAERIIKYKEKNPYEFIMVTEKFIMKLNLFKTKSECHNWLKCNNKKHIKQLLDGKI